MFGEYPNVLYLHYNQSTPFLALKISLQKFYVIFVTISTALLAKCVLKKTFIDLYNSHFAKKN